MVRKPAIATMLLVKPTDTSVHDDSIEEVVEEKKNKFNSDESTEAQEIIRDLTKQLSDLEDKYPEGGAAVELSTFYVLQGCLFRKCS